MSGTGGSWLTRLTAGIKHYLGVDRAIAFAVLGRGWASCAGLITLLLIARFLSRAEQGYYYTFFSLVALQIVFELGFSFVILQMASHERAHLNIAPDGQVTGETRPHARLASVLQKSVHWYTIAAGIMFAGLLPAGYYFFSHHTRQAASIDGWRLPWFLVVLASSLTFQIDPIFAFLDGCGFVTQIARTRFWQALASSLLAWIALTTHHGLYAPALMILAQASVGAGYLWSKRALLLGLFRYKAGEHRIAWFTEVWPFQWRIAVSWISGYFIFQIFNPVLFAFRGPVEAGQMGMSLSISTTVMAIGTAWIATKATPFGALIARKQYKELDSIFFRALAQSWLICLAICIVVFACDVYLQKAGYPLAHRLLSPPTFALLLLTVLANHLVFSEALYLRAHKEEKFLAISVWLAVFMGPSTYFLGRMYGAQGMVTGYLFLTLIIGLGFGTVTFFKYRRIWHAE